MEASVGGRQLERAEKVVGAISLDLAAASKDWLPRKGTHEGRNIVGSSLSNGFAGLAIYFAYAERSLQRNEHKRIALFLKKALRALNSLPFDPSLYRGISGIAWVVHHLHRLSAIEADEEAYSSVDEALIDLLEREDLHTSYDLVEGLVGVGVYFLDQLPHGSAKKGAKLVAMRLCERASRQAEGVCWKSPPEFLSPLMRNLVNGECWNLGMAHGSAGVISVLSRLCAEGVAVRGQRAVVENSVWWILKQESRVSMGPRYPCWVDSTGIRREGRYGWCYGDMSVAFALLSAGISMAKPFWERTALDIARHVAMETLEGKALEHLTDPYLCHGTSGMAHMFHRIFNRTGEDLFFLAARTCLERTLEQRVEGTGIGGYVSRYLSDRGENLWPNNPGLLNGAAGVGLALLAAISDQEPLWDRCMLLDLPPAPQKQNLS